MDQLAIFQSDTFTTSAGNLVINFLGHGSLIFQFQGKIIYIDPYGEVADYSLLPKADLIFITHDHFDHFDLKSLEFIRTNQTIVVLTVSCAHKKPFANGIIMHNGDQRVISGIPIEAVSAYNIIHKRDDGNPFHPKGEGNGYVFSFGDTRVYVAGDTENIPEMGDLRNIAIAFLPMNLPYTMTPEMVVDAALKFHPGILYPYHFGSTELQKFVGLMAANPDIEVRLRKMA